MSSDDLISLPLRVTRKNKGLALRLQGSSLLKPLPTSSSITLGLICRSFNSTFLSKQIRKAILANSLLPSTLGGGKFIITNLSYASTGSIKLIYVPRLLI